jgi:hypothetical protein
VRAQITKVGIDPDTCDKLPQWLAPDSDLWDQTIETRGFESIQSTIRTYPAYPHDGFPCIRHFNSQIAPLVIHLAAMCMRDTFGLLRDTGMGEEEVNALISETIEEMKQPDRCASIKLYRVYALKRGIPGRSISTI